MPTAKKLSIIFLFSILLFSVATTFVLARELEISYPAIGNILAPQTTKTLLTDYVKYILNFVYVVAGFIVAGVMAYAGFKAITEAHNPAALGEAKGRIFDALLGLIILFGSYVLLTTINPQLVIINPIETTKSGVILYKDPTVCEANKANPEANQKLIPETDWNRYGVSAGDLGKMKSSAGGAIYFYKPGSELEVTIYPQVNWEPKAGGTLSKDQKAGECRSFSGQSQSIELSWQNPGVYLCKADGKTCSVYNSSQGKLAEGYEDKITLIKFKNLMAYDTDISQCSQKGGTVYEYDNQGNKLEQPVCGYESLKYGAVLHEGRDYTETCKEFFTESTIPKGSTNIFPGADGVSSITVFLQADKQAGQYKIAEGSEVMLCKNTECVGAKCETANCDSPPDKMTEGASVILRYGTGTPERAQGIYYSPTGDGKFSNFTQLQWQNPTMNEKRGINDKVQAIKIKGNLKVALFWDEDFQNKCEVLTTDSDPNLHTETGNTVGDVTSSIKIIPIKK